MKMVKRGIILIVFLIIFATPMFAEDLEYEYGIHLIRPESKYIPHDHAIPEFLSLEDLFFVSCIGEDAPIKSSVICTDSNNFVDVDSYEWTGEGNCVISSFNLEELKCNNIRIQSEYEKDGENNRIYKEIKVNKFSKLLDTILNTQYSDGGWKTTKDTAYGIWALSLFPETFDYELEKALDWLKLERNEDLKCWPKAPCDIPLTMEILYILSQSGYNDSRRVVNDARNWIENRQSFYYQEDTWSVKIEPRVNDSIISLAAYHDGEDIIYIAPNGTFGVNESEAYTLKFEAKINNTLYVISPDNFEAEIFDKFHRKMLEFSGNNLTYYVPGACWSQKVRGEPCDSQTTGFAAILDIDEPNKEEAKRWMFSRRNYTDEVGIFYETEESPIDTALMIQLMKNDTLENIIEDYEPYMERYEHLDKNDRFERYVKEMINWLKFKQNNEGSWGSYNDSIENKTIPTAIAVHSLISSGFNRTDESIEDAEEYLSLNEEKIPKNETYALGSAFYVLRNNARPLLTVNPGIIQIEKDVTTVEMYNPTTFHLKELTYEFTNGLEEFLSVDEKKEMSAYSYRKLNIRKKDSSKTDLFGFLIISNLDDQVIKIPIKTTDFPTLNISIAETTTIFGKTGSIPLKVSKSAHEFTCTADWDDSEITTPGSFKISSNSATLKFSFTDVATKDKLYTGNIKCTAKEMEYEIPISVYISRFSSYPITINPKNIFINSSNQDIVFQVRNNLDQDLTAQIKINGRGTEYFDILSEVHLNPNEERNLTAKNLMLEDLNFTSSFTIDITAYERKESLPVVVDIVQIEKPLITVGLIMLILFTILLGVGGFFGYKYREKIISYFKTSKKYNIQHEIKKNMESLKQIKHEEKHKSIANMAEILKIQGKSSEEIKTSLLNYFSEDEIKNAITKENLNISGFEE